MLVRQTLRALAAVEQIARLISEQIDAGRSTGRTGTEDLQLNGAGRVAGGFLFDAQALSLSGHNVRFGVRTRHRGEQTIELSRFESGGGEAMWWRLDVGCEFGGGAKVQACYSCCRAGTLVVLMWM